MSTQNPRFGTGDPVEATRRAYGRGAKRWAQNAVRKRGAWADSYNLMGALARRGSLVLDLGCGAGYDAAGLVERGFRPIGVDNVPALATLADGELGFAGRVAVGDMRSLPFRSEAFGGVWADGSLHHVPKSLLPAVLNEIVRVLEPGGAVVASVERGSGEGFEPPADGLTEPRFYARYEREKLEYAFATAGLEPHRADFQTEGFIVVGGLRRY